MAEKSLPATTEVTPAIKRAPARWGQLIVWLAVVGLLGAIGWKLWQSSLGQVSAGAAPDFALTTFDGQALRLSDLRGQAVVINFWASWCIPCGDEAPILERTWQAYRERSVVLLGVAYLDDENAARQFIAEFGISYPNGLDVGTLISPLYRIKGIPETFFVDRAGELRGVYIGPIPEAELRQRIEALLVE